MIIKAETNAQEMAANHEKRLREVETALLTLAAGYLIYKGSKQVLSGVKLIAKSLEHLNEPLYYSPGVNRKYDGLYFFLNDALGKVTNKG